MELIVQPSFVSAGRQESGAGATDLVKLCTYLSVQLRPWDVESKRWILVLIRAERRERYVFYLIETLQENWAKATSKRYVTRHHPAQRILQTAAHASLHVSRHLRGTAQALPEVGIQELGPDVGGGDASPRKTICGKLIPVALGARNAQWAGFKGKSDKIFIICFNARKPSGHVKQTPPPQPSKAPPHSRREARTLAVWGRK